MAIGRALTVAGSDSGGGAGIQADLKTFMAFGVYGLTAVTAVTAQNTLGVAAVRPVDPDLVAAQIDAVVTDMGVDVVKIGMLWSAEIIEVVDRALAKLPGVPVVIDPVLKSTAGRPLLQPDAEDALRDLVIRRATVVTPNLAEAETLLGFPVEGQRGMARAARALGQNGVPYVLVKGGHLPDTEGADDVLWARGQLSWLRGERILTNGTHGTGCTLASAIAAGIARGDSPEQAVAVAKRYLTEALKAAPGLGAGRGPVLHHWGQNQWI